MKALLFYAGGLVAELTSYRTKALSLLVFQDYDSEIYNGGYLYLLESPMFENKNTWWRCDLTPVLEADVPKELKLLALLIR